MNRQIPTVFVLLALLVALPASAFRPRPISDLRFEHILENAQATTVASDGDDYLVLLQQYPSGTYTQAVSHGVPYGPAVLIGMGSGGSVVWTGSEYLVAWAGQNGISVSRVSRSGALLSGPKQLLAGTNLSTNAVSNGRRILVTAESLTELRGVLLDLNGQPVGQPFTAAQGHHTYAMTGTGDGFAVATFGYDETRVFRFDDAGQPVVAGGTRIEGPYVGHADTYFSDTGSIASDGANVAVIFTGVQYQLPSALKTAVVGPRGEIVQPARTIMTGLTGQSGLMATYALWNGSEYIVTLSLRRDINANVVDPALLRISGAGEQIAPASLLLDSAGYQATSAMASNGREYLITLQEPGGTFFVRVPFGTTTAGDQAQLTRLLDPQHGPVIGGGRRDYLAAWIETGQSGSTIRASRIDAHGRYLDGAGIVLATVSATNQRAISVDSDGENWLVVWWTGAAVRGRRVSSDGVLLDPQPIAIAAGDSAVVRYGGGSWLVVSSTGYQVTSTPVSREGVVGVTSVFAEAPAGAGTMQSPYVHFESPALAFDGRQFVVALTRHSAYTVLTVQPVFADEISVVTARLDPHGIGVIGSSSTVMPPDSAQTSELSLATNGSQQLVVYQGGGKVAGVLLADGAAPTSVTIANGFNSTATMWNGREFVVALSNSDGMQVVGISAQGIVGSSLMVPHDPDERSSAPAFPPSFPATPAATPQSGPPLVFVTQHDAYDAVPRAAFAFVADLEESLASPQTPAAPSIGHALRDNSGLTLTWAPQDDILGFSIELRQQDGSERVLGVAAGSASSTHLSYSGLLGTTLRLRAWNAAGLSSPSAEVQPATRKRAAGS